MKSLLFVAIFMVAGLAARCQPGAHIVFTHNDTTYDFGAVGKDDGAVYHFEIKNTGDVPLEITAVKCDNPLLVFQFPNKPVKPGKKSMITVLWPPKPDADNGSFKTDVFITSNATPAPYPFLHILGAIVPGQTIDVPKQKGGSKGVKASMRANTH